MVLTSILFTLMVTVFVAYVMFIWMKYGKQTSISESYYTLQKEKKGFLFVLFTWLFAFPAMILGNSYWMFFAGGGIVWVGGNAAMHKNPTRTIHLVAAIGGMILGCFAMIFQYHMWYIVVGAAMLSLLALLLDKKYYMWWSELIIFTAISIVLGISIF